MVPKVRWLRRENPWRVYDVPEFGKLNSSTTPVLRRDTNGSGGGGGGRPWFLLRRSFTGAKLERGVEESASRRRVTGL
jgi:hypothetical protein